jgi:hypothetical protein
VDVGTTEAAKKGRLKVEFLENGAGAEAPLSHFQQLAARLKSCPDTKPVKATVGASFSAACTAGLPPHRPPRGCPPVGGDPGSPTPPTKTCRRGPRFSTPPTKTCRRGPRFSHPPTKTCRRGPRFSTPPTKTCRRGPRFSTPPTKTCRRGPRFGDGATRRRNCDGCFHA